MASDQSARTAPTTPTIPTIKDATRERGLKHFLLHRRRGQLLLALCTLRFLGALGLIPGSLSTLSTVGLWTYALGFLIWGLSGLRRSLLWRIRRKLFISYLLIGLVPTILLLSFFALSGYFTLGQVSSFMLISSVKDAEMRAAGASNLMIFELRGGGMARSRLSDARIRKVLNERIQGMGENEPSWSAVYLEHRRGRIQRVVTTVETGFSPSVGTNLPQWFADGYRGAIEYGGVSCTAGVSTPHESARNATIIVLATLSDVLEKSAEELGFHIDQVLASDTDDTTAESVFIRQPAPLDGESQTATPASSAPLTFPWWTLLPTRSLDDPHREESELAFVQFGFPLNSFYSSIATGALQLGPSGPDLGAVLLTAMALLAGLFLVIEVSAIFVGLVLARSITGSVHALSQGTEHVRQGDFSYRVQVRSRDQLGELAESFNLMTTSIQDLLSQSSEKKRMAEELRIARTIQMSLLPRDRVDVPGLSIAPFCLPAHEVGGDYYDFIPLSDGRFALLIADVSGKGTSAALYMAELKGLTLSLSQIYDSPRKLLVEANKILAATLDSRSFITMAYAVIDMNDRQMTYARAGHNPIFHVPANGAEPKTNVLAPDGLGLALDRGTQFERILKEDVVSLCSGDVFLFFTDGVSEAMNPSSELFGEARIRLILEENADLQMEELREKLVDEVFDFAGGAVQHDDMTMVLLKVL